MKRKTKAELEKSLEEFKVALEVAAKDVMKERRVTAEMQDLLKYEREIVKNLNAQNVSLKANYLDLAQKVQHVTQDPGDNRWKAGNLSKEHPYFHKDNKVSELSGPERIKQGTENGAKGLENWCDYPEDSPANEKTYSLKKAQEDAVTFKEFVEEKINNVQPQVKKDLEDTYNMMKRAGQFDEYEIEANNDNSIEHSLVLTEEDSRNPVLVSAFKTFVTCLKMLKKKGADYAQEIDAYSNFRDPDLQQALDKYGVPWNAAKLSCRILIKTRMNRFLRITLLGKAMNESLEDSHYDIINFMAIHKDLE